MRVIFACAGTGGHINPAIAIANIILKHDPSSEILFIGTKTGLENELVKNAGFDIKHIETGKLIRSFTFKNISAVTKTNRGVREAKLIIKEFKPDIVIGTGGYICVPVMIAAKKNKIPYILHESNAYPGIAVKILSKRASKVMVGFLDAKNRLKRKDNVVYTGTPAKFSKKDIDILDNEECKRILDLQNINKKIVFVTGGSQGAMCFNQIVLDMVTDRLSDNFFVILVAGNKNYDYMRKKIEEIEKQRNIDLSRYIRVEKFVYDMTKMYKVADLCITRAGAMTITELEIARKSAILVPLPTAAENHQYFNAKILEQKGYGCIIEQKSLDKNILFNKIEFMLNSDAVSNKLRKENKNEDIYENNAVDDKIFACISEVLKSR